MKQTVLKRPLLEGAATSDLCGEYGLNRTVFYRWQRELFEKKTIAFEKED